jgi:hypothetical protein
VVKVGVFWSPLPLNLAMTCPAPAPDVPPEVDPPPLAPEAGTETIVVTVGAGSATGRVTV